MIKDLIYIISHQRCRLSCPFSLFIKIIFIDLLQAFEILQYLLRQLYNLRIKYLVLNNRFNCSSISLQAKLAKLRRELLEPSGGGGGKAGEGKLYWILKCILKVKTTIQVDCSLGSLLKILIIKAYTHIICFVSDYSLKLGPEDEAQVFYKLTHPLYLR